LQREAIEKSMIERIKESFPGIKIYSGKDLLENGFPVRSNEEILEEMNKWEDPFTGEFIIWPLYNNFCVWPREENGED
jgi:hypothetical protein